MKIYVENNEKHGKGFQMRMVDVLDDGRETEDVVDFRPYNLEEAALMIRKMLEIYNRKHNTNITLEECLESRIGKSE